MHKYHLFSPSRLKWVRKTHKGCLFCRIVENDPKVPKKVLYRNDNLLVVMNMFPYNTGHLQVLPARHVEDFEELSGEEISSLFTMVKKCIKLLKKVLKPVGFNVGINIGEAAGASVPHLHIHIVPRFRRDFGFMEVIGETKVLPETLEQTYEKLRKEVGMLK